MPSAALARWEAAAQRELDEIEAAHRAVAGTTRPGRRFATLQINHGYALLLSSQFQGFCRDLHTEAVDFLASEVQPVALGNILRLVMTVGRKLDSGNPNAGNIGSDFARIGMANFWPDLEARFTSDVRRHAALDKLNTWRNAIAHQDWRPVGGNRRLLLKTVQRWRRSCRILAQHFDDAVNQHLTALIGRAPW